jgi:chromosome segregation ATPase
MQANIKTKTILCLSLLTLLSTGCVTFDEPLTTTPGTISAEEANTAVQKRFQDSTPKSASAVDSAIELAQKHSELSEKMSNLKQEYVKLLAENDRMENHIAILEPDLKQTKKELEQANNLLLNMRIELNEWKTNILGFRDEMRNADKAQIQALIKIFEALGGEVTIETKDQQDDNTSASQTNEKPISKSD